MKIKIIVSILIVMLILVIVFGGIRNNSVVYKYNKLFDIYSAAVSNGVLENGTIETWDAKNATLFFQKIKSGLHVEKICGTSDVSENCFVHKYPRLNGVGYINMYKKNYYKFVLKDGSSGAIFFNFPKCDINDSKTNSSPLEYLCGSVWFDVNGPKLPNVYGEDLFQLLITKNGVLVPRGAQDDKNYSIETHCSSRSHSGDACGAWIKKYGNTEYLNQ